MKAGERATAKKAGLKHYFTGKPCLRGHVAERLVSTRNCLECKAIVDKQRDFKRLVEYQRKSRLRDPEKARQRNRQKHERHKEKRNAYSRAYSKRNREQLNAYQRRWLKNAPLSSKVGHILRCRLRSAIKNRQKAGSAISDLGCSIDEFINFISTQFRSGMNWNNWGVVWELDHIMPVALFDLSKREQFVRVCHYTNLQPLLVEEHILKTANDIRRIRELNRR